MPQIADDIEEMAATNVFDYRTAFHDVFCNGGFDYIIGNPPYVEVKNYNVALPCMSSYIKKRYKSSKNGKIDLAIPFIERGLELLNEHGSLGYIIQKRFFKTDYGKGIRKILSDNRLIRTIYDYNETDLFENRITYVAIVVCDKSTTDKMVIKYTNSSNNECVEISKKTITETPWSFEKYQINELRTRLANELGQLKDICKIRVGVQVLWDKAFHIVVNHIDDNYIYGSTAICENLKVEREACRALLCNEQFVPLSIRPHTTYILFPYDVIDGRVQEILFSDFENRYPLAGSYLRKQRTVIESSVQTVPELSPMLDRDEYWHLFTRVNNHNAVYKKICVPMTAQNPQASVVMQENVYCDNANMFFIQIPEITDNKLYAMAAIINSTPFAYFAKSIANPQQGDFYKFNKQFLDPIPFPCNEYKIFGNRMRQLVNVARRIEETNTAIATNVSSASRLYPLLNNLWKEIDNLCCDFYNLTETEKEIIMSNPRKDHKYE